MCSLPAPGGLGVACEQHSRGGGEGGRTGTGNGREVFSLTSGRWAACKRHPRGGMGRRGACYGPPSRDGLGVCNQSHLGGEGEGNLQAAPQGGGRPLAANNPLIGPSPWCCPHSPALSQASRHEVFLVASRPHPTRTNALWGHCKKRSSPKTAHRPRLNMCVL